MAARPAAYAAEGAERSPHPGKAALLASERRYFTAGATAYPADGGEVAVLPGLAHLPAGCLVHRLDTARIERDPPARIDRIEGRVRELGGGYARLYLDDPLPNLARALQRRGYRRTDETGLIAPARAGVPSRHASGPEVALVCVGDDPAAWSRRHAVYTHLPLAPDGFACAADDWIRMEQTRIAAGYMEAFEIQADGIPCGAVNLAAADRLVRLENLAIHPSHQRRGIASAVAARFPFLAATRRCAWSGVFALTGSIGERLYRRAGFAPILHRPGWSRRLTGSR